MHSDLLLLLSGSIALSVAAPASAADKTPSKPQAFKDLVQCRALADPDQRLACYDAQVGKLEQAVSNGDVVIADRASIREAKTGLFGFRIPTLGIFGGSTEDKDEVTSIEGTVSTARQLGYGAWRVTLSDNSTWEQIDTEKLVFDPAKGSKVKIYRGVLGTFRMNLDGQRAIKVRRVE